MKYRLLATSRVRVAEPIGRSVAQVVLAWLRHRPVPVIPILAARKVSQLQDNLASLNLNLSAEQVKALDEASSIELRLRYYLQKRANDLSLDVRRHARQHSRLTKQQRQVNQWRGTHDGIEHKHA